MSSTDKGIRGYVPMVCPNGHTVYVSDHYNFWAVECTYCGEYAEPLDYIQQKRAERADNATPGSQHGGDE